MRNEDPKTPLKIEKTSRIIIWAILVIIILQIIFYRSENAFKTAALVMPYILLTYFTIKIYYIDPIAERVNQILKNQEPSNHLKSNKED